MHINNNITINLKNVQPEPTSKPVNKFYPYLVYVTRPTYENAKIRLEKVLLEMKLCR